MSGSSLDGLDMALCQFSLPAKRQQPDSWQFLHGATRPFPARLQERLRTATDLSGLALMQLHRDLGQFMGKAAADFLNENSVTEKPVIASHGHTVFHYPQEQLTTQIGDGAAIAVQSGCTTICDFRSVDVAYSGQGAPVAPIADLLLFPMADYCLNLGGIANISYRSTDGFTAFDVTGANQLLNAAAAEQGLPYDAGGQLAREGQLVLPLLTQLNQADYFQQKPPKSLGNDWVQKQLVHPLLQADCSTMDKLHTACVHLCQQIDNSLQWIPPGAKASPQVLITGGGAHNTFVTELLEASFSRQGISIIPADAAIIDFKEAILMALMGALRLHEQDNCLATVTGARQNSIGGAVYVIK